MNKTFRAAKARQLTKRNPETGNTYIFTRDRDLVAVKNGCFNQLDEDWMVWMSTKAGNSLLVWTNMPQEAKDTILVDTPNVVKLSDLSERGRKDKVPEFHIGKSQSEIDAEVKLAEYWDAIFAANAEPKVKELTDKQKAIYFAEEVERLLEENETLAERNLALELELQELTCEDEVSLGIMVEEAAEELIEATSEEIVSESVDAEVEETAPVSEELAMFMESFAQADSLDDFVSDMKTEFNVSALTNLAEEVGLDYEGTKAEMIEKIVETLEVE